ncbi:MAG: hypothetical protein HUU02_02725 [Bacteroidetes bacterium]|nr:hypothetical protein [Bacteroidota bacterium]
MPEQQTIELRCSKNPDGKYNARTFINGKEVKGKEFSVNRGDQFSLVLVYHQIKKQYAGAAVQIKGVDKNTEASILHSEL